MTAIYAYADKKAKRAFMVSDDLVMKQGIAGVAEKLVRFDDRFVAGVFGEETLRTALKEVAYHYLVSQARPPMQTILDDTVGALRALAPKIHIVLNGLSAADRQDYFDEVAPNGVPQGCSMYLLDVADLKLYLVYFGTVVPTTNLVGPNVAPVADAVLHGSTLGVQPPFAAAVPSRLAANCSQLMDDLIAAARNNAPPRSVGQLGTWAEVVGRALSVHSVFSTPAARI